MSPEEMFFIGMCILFTIYMIIGIHSQQKKIDKLAKHLNAKDIIFMFKNYKPKE